MLLYKLILSTAFKLACLYIFFLNKAYTFYNFSLVSGCVPVKVVVQKPWSFFLTGKSPGVFTRRMELQALERACRELVLETWNCTC